MLSAFEAFIDHHGLFDKSDRLLATVSGGLDSTVMVHLLAAGGYQFAIAHVNFQLRGSDSDEDASFVARLAKELEVPFFSKTVATQSIERKGESLQMYARRLRYSWFKDLAQKEGFDRILTAHHADDAVETFFLNFARGSGLGGLLGIPAERGPVTRPMLFASRDEIEKYAIESGISWREDQSNEDDKYDRNKVRHHLLPVFRKLNPAFDRTAVDNLDRLAQAYALMEEAVAYWERQCVQRSAGQWRIHWKLIEGHPALSSMLFHWLSPMGYNGDQISQLIDSLDHTGAIFFSDTHRLLVDREQLLVERKPAEQKAAYGQLRQTGDHLLGNGWTIEAKGYEKAPWPVPSDPNQAWLDADALRFPLEVRHWREGDIFQPLGLGGRRQKLQDFFSNMKLDRFEKERTLIVETEAGEICWIIGKRIDHRFRLKKESRQCVALFFHRHTKT